MRSARARVPTAPLRATLGSFRADPPAGDRHRVAGSRRRGSPVKRPFQLLDQLGDIVEREPGLELAEIARAYPERLTRRRRPSTGQPNTQRFIDDLAEGPAGPSRLRLELGRYIIVKGQGRPHALMLGARHHDVKERASRRTATSETAPAAILRDARRAKQPPVEQGGQAC